MTNYHEANKLLVDYLCGNALAPLVALVIANEYFKLTRLLRTTELDRY